MDAINFKAKYIKPVTVKKFDGRAYRLKRLNLVELESSDKKAINVLRGKWHAALADSIATDVDHLEVHQKERLGKVLAITEQDFLYELLDPNQIQVLASIQEQPFKNNTKITYLQVNPQHISEKYGTIKDYIRYKIDKFLHPKFYKKPPVLYKGLGTAMLESIKELVTYDCIELISLKKSLMFYLKNGFKFANFKENKLIWKRKSV